ncbi:NHL domain-containing protein [Actinidia rufa]|uniref:NHL domain-containing protein n=1 Tax=Actinidia rufa TaxID=165716 RepID=A0A7J0EQM5_9ERIC|nr:NHL domain-containing protein [Actinidia rufa]
MIGVTTIAGGKWGRGGGHVDGPSEDAKFSNDFDVVYIGGSCSLLVIDRGNQAIREIQLHFDDCAYQYGSGFPLVLVVAGFFGYKLALLQRRAGTIVSPSDLWQSCEFYSGWDGDLPQKQKPPQKQQHHHQYRSSTPQTYYAQSCDEVVFGEVQEQDGWREAVMIKPLDHWNSIRDERNICSQINSMGNTYAN